MSIIPGMENLAPERTDTSSGSAASPSVRPIFFSSAATWCLAISASRPVGPAGGHVGAAGVGGDREAGRYRQLQHARHLGEVGALAAEQVLHVHRRAAVLVIEGVDVGHGFSLLAASATPRPVAQVEDRCTQAHRAPGGDRRDHTAASRLAGARLSERSGGPDPYDAVNGAGRSIPAPRLAGHDPSGLRREPARTRVRLRRRLRGSPDRSPCSRSCTSWATPSAARRFGAESAISLSFLVGWASFRPSAAARPARADRHHRRRAGHRRSSLGRRHPRPRWAVTRGRTTTCAPSAPHAGACGGPGPVLGPGQPAAAQPDGRRQHRSPPASTPARPGRGNRIVEWSDARSSPRGRRRGSSSCSPAYRPVGPHRRPVRRLELRSFAAGRARRRAPRRRPAGASLAAQMAERAAPGRRDGPGCSRRRTRRRRGTGPTCCTRPAGRHRPRASLARGARARRRTWVPPVDAPERAAASRWCELRARPRLPAANLYAGQVLQTAMLDTGLPAPLGRLRRPAVRGPPPRRLADLVATPSGCSATRRRRRLAAGGPPGASARRSSCRSRPRQPAARPDVIAALAAPDLSGRQRRRIGRRARPGGQRRRRIGRSARGRRRVDGDRRSEPEAGVDLVDEVVDGTRTCSVESRSRMVTALSSSDSKSTVTPAACRSRPGGGSGARSTGCRPSRSGTAAAAARPPRG